MKKRINNQGSAHVIIIVVLVVALLGALGVIFWQNFIAKTVTSTHSLQYIAVGDWPVKIPVDTKELGTEIVYIDLHASATVGGFDSESYAFKTTRVAALGGTCAMDGYGLASLVRSTQDLKEGDSIEGVEGINLSESAAYIDGWYYYVEKNDEPCSDTDIELQMSDANRLEKILKSVEANY